jgi:hypothetical protein
VDFISGKAKARLHALLAMLVYKASNAMCHLNYRVERENRRIEEEAKQKEITEVQKTPWYKRIPGRILGVRLAIGMTELMRSMVLTYIDSVLLEVILARKEGDDSLSGPASGKIFTQHSTSSPDLGREGRKRKYPFFREI